MRKRRAMAFLVLIALLLSVAAFAYNGGVTVYVTRTGECYHRDGCSYLKSRIPISLESAVASGYRACSRCRPPVLNEDRPTDADPYTRSGNSDNGTGSTSGGSSSAASTTPRVTSPAENSSGNKSSSSGHFFWLVAGSSVAAFGLYKLLRIGIKRLEDREKFNAKRAVYLERYANKSLNQLVPFPPDSYLTDDLLPYRRTGRGSWGGRYTFFVSRSGQCYHWRRGCNHANIEINAFMLSEFAKPRRNLRPCRKCNPVLPDVRWVQQCREIAEIKRKYNIP